ncbi:cupin domain-containing protein [Streptomyces avicenniae]|uniref:cupin domain-containing protein n=1 Tax=Streptomyces avicenniae TaxID=500153 RepID=UPI000B2E3350|nr:cupin domain-containing protein [Streptomyces avicenniae]
MEIFTFDRAERVVGRFGSVGTRATRVAAGDGGAVSLTCLTLAPGGTIGAHRAPVPQLFLVVAGDGWVAGADGRRTPVTAGTGVRWDADETHASGSEAGLTALALEGAGLRVFPPDPPDPPDPPGSGDGGRLV